MKTFLNLTVLLMISFSCFRLQAQTSEGDPATVNDVNPSNHAPGSTNLYLDVHHFGPGKVTYEAVAEAHKKDLAVEKKYGVQFVSFWLDEARGDVYCLVISPDSGSIRQTHAAAHGLLPDRIYLVQGGTMSKKTKQKKYFMDMHVFGPGHVTAKDVAAAHQKDLAVQKAYGVNLLNYWVNEKEGIVICLAQAPNANALINTHKQAHGLIPEYVDEVKVGQ